MQSSRSSNSKEVTTEAERDKIKLKKETGKSEEAKILTERKYAYFISFIICDLMHNQYVVSFACFMHIYLFAIHNSLLRVCN